MPEVVRVSLRRPVRERQRKGGFPPLPADIERRLAEEIPRRVLRKALVPPSVERQLKAATLAAEKA